MRQYYCFIKVFSCTLAFSMWLYGQSLLTDETATYEYKGESFKLGLYEGSNDIPDDHLVAGMELAKEMRKMDKINIVPVGHSVPNTTFNGWNWGDSKSQFNLAGNTNFKDGSAPAVMAWDWLSRFNGTISSLGGLAASDIHVLVIQLTWAPFFGPDNYEKNTPLSEKIDSMSHDLGRLALNAKKKLPNLKMILMQADPWQNDHEPYHAYHEWFFARQVVLDQINGESDLAYTGPDSKAPWMCLGGYWWKPNSDRSYYTDCCHISGSGAGHYREEWIKALLEYNPVVSHWLLKDPPDIPVNVCKAMKSLTAVQRFKSYVKDNGVVVSLSLIDAARVSMGLFSIDGRTMVPMSERYCQAGLTTISLTTGGTLPPGAYIVRMNNAAGAQSLHLTTVTK